MNRHKLEQELSRLVPPRITPPESHKRELENLLRSNMITHTALQPLTAGGYLSLGIGVLAICLVISFALQPRGESHVIAFPIYRGDDLNQQSYMILPVVPISYERTSDGLDQSRK